MIFKNFFKKSPILSIQSFNNVINFVTMAMKYEMSESNNQLKINFLDYLISTIKIDLQTDLLSAILYNGDKLREINDPFPFICYDENGQKIDIYKSDKIKKKVDLAKDCVLVLPWNSSRYVSSLLYLKNVDFEYQSDNHFSNYYEYIDICYIHNGLHSSSAGVTYKKGYIYSNIFNTKLLFPHIKTDGEKWINIHTNKPIDKVWDFRIATIYELCKMKFNLEQE